MNQGESACYSNYLQVYMACGGHDGFKLAASFIIQDSQANYEPRRECLLQ